jgi:tyrosyl-tRNA synthetase
MMWRYYELLTDISVAEIAKVKQEAHPMQAKKELARRIVADFHSKEAAKKAAEDWAKQFQKDEVPDSVEEIHLSLDQVRWGEAEKDYSPNGIGFPGAVPGYSHVGIRLDRLLVICGLADSTTEAVRKIKQGAVRVFENVEKDPRIQTNIPARLPLRVGKKAKVAVIER